MLLPLSPLMQRAVTGGPVKVRSAPPVPAPKRVRPESGPGSILMRLFKSLGFDAGEPPEVDQHLGGVTLAGCGSCHQVADLMDERGPDWCEANADALVEKISENAAKKNVPFFGTADKLPFFETAVRNRLARAIELSRSATDH